jgi:predicted dehydrogenase
MADARRIGIIMHGVTGRMGLNQHLIRSVLAIRKDGGVLLSDGRRVMPDPIIVGRNRDKIAALANRLGIERWTDDLDAALANPEDTVFFDAASTQLRPGLLKKAIDAGKHVYSEKPVSESLAEAVEIARYAKAKGVKNGIVHDKLDLPGLRKLKRLRDRASSGASSRSRATSATGCSRATGCPRSARRGTTASRTAAGSCRTCSATGAMSSTTSWPR